MRTLCTKQSTKDSTKQKFAKAKSAPTLRSRSNSPLSEGISLLQRKCACGGGCPHCTSDLALQTRLKTDESVIQYEEAVSVPDRITSTPELLVQRQAEPPEAPETESLDELLPGQFPESETIDDLLAMVPPVEQKQKSECLKGRVLRWGCDTVCSHNGFWDVSMLPNRESTKCCNMWPPFVERYARTHLRLNGAASCRGARRRAQNQMATVTHRGKSVTVLCTDAFSKADHEIELSPLAMQDLHGSFDNIRTATVCYHNSSIETCKEPHAKRGNQSHPQEDHCVSTGCQSFLNDDDRKSCSQFGWPNN